VKNFITYGCIIIVLSTLANIGAAATQCSTTSTFSSHSGAGNEFLDPGNCSKDAESFKLKVYEFAICTSHATVADKSMCTTLFEDTAGSDLTLSKGASLPLGADVTLAEGTYTHAYILVDNVMYLKVSHEFSSVRRDRGGLNSGIYCYSNGVDRVYTGNPPELVNSIITCSNTAPTTATNLPTKETLSFADDSENWVSSMVDNATGTNLYMLKADGTASTSLATDDTILASQDITDVVISPTTAGMNIAFTVTDTVGLMIQPAGNGGTCPAGTGDCVVDSGWIGMQFRVTAN